MTKLDESVLFHPQALCPGARVPLGRSLLNVEAIDFPTESQTDPTIPWVLSCFHVCILECNPPQGIDALCMLMEPHASFG